MEQNNISYEYLSYSVFFINIKKYIQNFIIFQKEKSMVENEMCEWDYICHLFMIHVHHFRMLIMTLYIPFIHMYMYVFIYLSMLHRILSLKNTWKIVCTIRVRNSHLSCHLICKWPNIKSSNKVMHYDVKYLFFLFYLLESLCIIHQLISNIGNTPQAISSVWKTMPMGWVTFSWAYTAHHKKINSIEWPHTFVPDPTQIINLPVP